MVREIGAEEVAPFSERASTALAIGIIALALEWCVLLISLITRRISIRAALRLYQYISPEVVAANARAMALIAMGHDQTTSVRETFVDADAIISRLGVAVFLVDADLRVIGANPAAERFVGTDPHGRELAVLADGRGWEEIAGGIREIRTGVRGPQFTELVEFPDGRTVLANAIGLLVHRAARDGEASKIDRVALVLTDWTDVMNRQRDIETEQRRLSAMLKKVIPAKVCDELETGTETLAAVSQSVTIGEIRITPESWDDIGVHTFFAKAFGEFAALLGGFEMLSLARICYNRFVYAGGLLEKNRKPARHAEEAVRFALMVLAKGREIAMRIGRAFEIRVGVHTGGPIATGVMSLKRPAFQIIGPVLGVAAQLAEEGLAGEVYLSRATYELIFASGFRIRERGELVLRGGGTTMTYLV
jgi:PAS domain-containing protein